MMPTDLYPWLKAAHVACALLFVGGVLAGSLVLAANLSAPDRIAPLASALRRWDRMVTIPAMLGVWAFGIGLAIWGGWFAYFWLQAKVVLVVVLSAVHGIQSGKIRRLSSGAAVLSLNGAKIVLPIVVAIAVLAVAKP